MKKKSSKKILTAKTPPLSGVRKRSEEKELSSGRGPYSFFADVYDVVRQIPKGKVSTYGTIAAYLGTKLSARMVGWAMNAAHTAKPKVPAQRVVNRNGMLTGKHHFATPDTMELLLKKEGIAVKHDVIVDFKKHFWDPAEALEL